jgi:hypothetical protein
MNDDAYHTRFWTTWLHHAVFFSGISFTAMFFLSGQITAFAGWNTVIRRVWESMSQFMWVGIILMGLIVAGVWGHLHHLYHWNAEGVTDPNSPHFDKIIDGNTGLQILQEAAQVGGVVPPPGRFPEYGVSVAVGHVH